MACYRGCLLATLAVALALAFRADGAEGPAKPLRGKVPVPETNDSGIYRMERHDRAIQRSHAWQPPIIPHNIKGYQITRNVNMCLVCHAARNAPGSGATPVGASHYLDRDGTKLENISTRRYFCLQCHVPQYDAEPLVENTFRSPK